MPALDSFVGDGLAPSPYKEALAEIERLRAERDRYHDALIARHGGEPIALLSELDEARAERDALRAALYGMLDVTHAWVTDSHCEFCVRHAPKTDEGEILGPVPHGSDCEYAASRAALAREGGGRSACLDCGGSECICRAERVERELLARAERAEAERDALKVDAERYRWLRERLSHPTCGPHVGWGTDTLLPGDDPDAAIDAARKEGEG